MRQNNLFAQTFREAPSDAEAISHQLLLRAGFMRQIAAGIYSYLPLGWRVLRKVEQIIREEMERTGAQELLMPAMQPAEIWKESGRYEVYGPELIRLHDRHDREFALGPTHEEVITILARYEMNSYRRMPVALFQIQTKFRDERRPRFGLLRGREFLMKDAYSFDMDWSGLDQSYKGMFEAYHRIFDRCGLNYRAVEADAGSIGGEGGTHEFIALADIGEDTIVSCTECHYAANVEMNPTIIVGETCPRCSHGELQFIRGIEIGHVFKLGTKYSELLHAKFLDQEGVEKPFIMGCYGIGVSRILSAVIEQNHDDHGMRWPMSIAPFHVHIIPVSIKDQVQMEIAEQLYQRLTSSSVEVLIDDREERTGVKLMDSDLMGIPIRIVVGRQASQGFVELKLRALEERETMQFGDVIDKVNKIIEEAKLLDDRF
jgi:prolyl-tRNA synthetase